MFTSRALVLVSSHALRRLLATRHFRRLPQSHTFASRSYGAIIPRRTYVISTDGENIENLIDHLSPSEYNSIANEYLETLSDDMEELGEEFPQIDLELTQGVMTLTVAEGKTYVINKQPPNKQIWLSSPYSGPKRYDLIGGRWITLRDNTSLTDLLAKELSEELGQEVNLSVEQ
ncbi:hypothetical protein HF325_003053 [Metschnikowia pulcherrima]|uniref:ferroxidase n=1 Tax=Metschnikowia pulcherrima TaxID=27326 RepID=A0A8H7GRN3_9ASCO|nr:hypothetical protein HF325_003053 [Metschnikowia pulcherrima]